MTRSEKKKADAYLLTLDARDKADIMERLRARAADPEDRIVGCRERPTITEIRDRAQKKREKGAARRESQAAWRAEKKARREAR